MSDLGRVHDDLYARMRARPGPHWWIAFAICAGGTAMLFALIAYTIGTGIGLWGNQVPVAWAFGIINFVFWVGIGHAGTFISAILYLLEQQRWRNPVSRLAETMTLFAVVQAALFPLLHLGRPWFAYWLLPYPDVMGVWPQVKSALPWDAAAISTYFLVSLLFWYVGLIPDLAAMRDQARTRRRRRLLALVAIGWRGDDRAWRQWKVTYLLLASIATPLVISVHSIVASDFAIGLTPGWHSTLQPPYFVAGAIFSGFAMVLVLAIPVRVFYRLQDVLVDRVLDNCAKLLLATGLIVDYGYVVEHFGAYYGGEPAERSLFFGHHPYSLAFWIMITCNVVVPQLLWWRRARRTPVVLFFIGLAVLVGMWFERFVIIVQGLERDQLPSAWSSFTPTWVDLGILGGTFAFFGFLYLLFLRFVPFLPVAELKEEQA
ncbi:MAG TPA: NrfD/PsrC family molybdoenzyme membrane anchor subunit [Kofleriaceae bacterium]|nr:NrfD/PsrC family molybdoenzyme membrane anchor subunit [Kofleriaceae bacterium]